MDTKPENSKNKIQKILLFLLLISLAVIGIWKCPKQTEENPKTEIPQAKEEKVELATAEEPEIISNEENIVPQKNEQNTPIEKVKPINTSKLRLDQDDPVDVNIKVEPPPKLEVEETPITRADLPKKEKLVFRADPNIDKRPPATSKISCKTTTTFKIDKASHQTSVSFSPDGSNFVVGNNNNYASIFNMEGQERLKLKGHHGYVLSTTYSSNGKFIGTSSVDKTAKVWDARTGKEIRSLVGHSESIFSMVFSPNGKFILTGSSDYTAILWDAKTGNQLFILKDHTLGITEVAFSSDSKKMITGSADKSAKIWEVSTGELLYTLVGHGSLVSGVLFANNDKTLITGSADKKIRIWNAETGKHLHTINGHASSIMSLKISKDGQQLLSSSSNGSIKLWELKGGKELCQFEGHRSEVRDADFHPRDKNRVVSASNDNTIRFWEFGME